MHVKMQVVSIFFEGKNKCNNMKQIQKFIQNL